MTSAHRIFEDETAPLMAPLMGWAAIRSAVPGLTSNDVCDLAALGIVTPAIRGRGTGHRHGFSVRNIVEYRVWLLDSYMSWEWRAAAVRALRPVPLDDLAGRYLLVVDDPDVVGVVDDAAPRSPRTPPACSASSRATNSSPTSCGEQSEERNSSAVSVCFVDLETTGLDPGRHDIWEIALIVDGATHLWHTKPDLAAADPNALRLNRFHERLAAEKWTWARKETVAAAVARLTAGRHLAGAVPSFDAGFLDVFLRRYGQCPAWHYHLVCVENLAAGTLRAEPPWNSTVLAEKLGVTISDEARHTALGDARWARDIYAAVMKEEKQP